MVELVCSLLSMVMRLVLPMSVMESSHLSYLPIEYI